MVSELKPDGPVKLGSVLPNSPQHCKDAFRDNADHTNYTFESSSQDTEALLISGANDLPIAMEWERLHHVSFLKCIDVCVCQVFTRRSAATAVMCSLQHSLGV